MKRWMMLVALLGTMVFQAGCGDGVAWTREERAQLRREIFENDMQQLVDDWDRLWLNDRKMHTSRWLIRDHF